MRTSVQTDRSDPDETDEFPGHAASVGDAGELVIFAADTGIIETMYDVGAWVSFTVDAEENLDG